MLSGTATIHIFFINGVQTTPNGPFSVAAKCRGAGVGTLFLTVYNFLAPFGTVTISGTVATEPIKISSNSTPGRGAVATPEASHEGFGVTLSNGGEFQCQNAGMSALLGAENRQMEVHETIRQPLCPYLKNGLSSSEDNLVEFVHST